MVKRLGQGLPRRILKIIAVEMMLKVPFKLIRFLFLGTVIFTFLLMAYDQLSFLIPSYYNNNVYTGLLVLGLLISVFYALGSARLIIAVNKLCRRSFRQFLAKTWGLGALLLDVTIISYFTAGMPFIGLFFMYFVINGIGLLIAYAINPLLDRMRFPQYAVYMTNTAKVYNIYAKYIVGVQECRKFY